MPAAERIFVDTNLLVYGQLRDSPLGERVSEHLSGFESGGCEIWISRQVLREYLVVMTRGTGLTAVPSIQEVVADANHFARRFRIAEDGPGVTQKLLELIGSIPCSGKQIHDANIVATMLAHGIGRLLTHNAKDFLRFSEYVSVEPLVV